MVTEKKPMKVSSALEMLLNHDRKEWIFFPCVVKVMGRGKL